MSTSKTMKHLLGKPLISGGIGALALPKLTGGTTFRYKGASYSLAGLGALLGFGSSFISELGHQYLMPHVSADAKLQHLESMVLSLALSGGSFVAIAKLLNSDLNMAEARQFAVAGAAAEVVSSYIATNFLSEEGTI